MPSTPTGGSLRYTKKISPSPSMKSHTKCFTVDCPPFGISRSCTRPTLKQIHHIIESCKAFVPSISLQQLLSSTTTAALIESDFPALEFDDNWSFSGYTFQINQLREAAQALSPATTFRPKIILHLKHHRALPSDNTALVVLGNLKTLYESIGKKRVAVEHTLWQGLDDYPEWTVVQLRALVNQSSLTPASFDGQLEFIKLQDFHTLGAGRWLNDEIVNYFVDKWCADSGTTLGLNSFFAPRCLFDRITGTPKCGVLTAADEDRVERWCRKTVAKQGLKDWDSVFIPINEMHTHWYSARIDFREKRLAGKMYQQPQETPLLRKNANLMLVLLWLTEVLSRLRGQEVDLKKNGGNGWVFDPHFKVHFQPNSYDCGIHLLWHLRHLLEFRQIKLEDDCQPRHLRFTDDMGGKRLRLAQEMLVDAGLA